jgi:hypothetical protein
MATYYFSPSGNDTTGDGSESNRWQTFSKAQTEASAGDVCLFAAGTYPAISADVTQSTNGTAGSPITFQAEDLGAAAASLIYNRDPTVTDDSNMVFFSNSVAGSDHIINGNWVVYRGFYHNEGPGVTVGGDDVLVEHCLFYGRTVTLDGPGISGLNASRLRIYDCESWMDSVDIDINVDPTIREGHSCVSLINCPGSHIRGGFYYMGGSNTVVVDDACDGTIVEGLTVWDSENHTSAGGKKTQQDITMIRNRVFGGLPKGPGHGRENEFWRIDGQTGTQTNIRILYGSSYKCSSFSMQDDIATLHLRNCVIDTDISSQHMNLQSCDAVDENAANLFSDYNCWLDTDVDFVDTRPQTGQPPAEQWTFQEWRDGAIGSYAVSNKRDFNSQGGFTTDLRGNLFYNGTQDKLGGATNSAGNDRARPDANLRIRKGVVSPSGRPMLHGAGEGQTDIGAYQFENVLSPVTPKTRVAKCSGLRVRMGGSKL